MLVKSKVEEYKQIKKENESQKKLEQELAEMWEAEARRKAAAEIIPKFQQRVKITSFIKQKLYQSSNRG